MRAVLIIANPIAGGGHAAAAALTLVERLETRSIAAELRLTNGRSDVERFAREAIPARFDAVVSVGGDGTLNCVLQHLPDPTIPIAMMPFGTANVLAHELRLPRDPERIAGMLAALHTIEAPIGLVRETSDGVSPPRRFLLFAGAGLDGAMVEELEKVRRGPLGKLRWFRPVLTIVRHLPRARLTVETDDGTVLEDLGEVLVTRVRSYGGVFTMPGDIDIRDGHVHVLCFRQRTRWQWLRAAFRAFLGRLRLGRDVEHRTARRVRIRADATAAYHVDGDLAGHAPLEIELDSRRARLVVPPPV